VVLNPTGQIGGAEMSLLNIIRSLKTKGSNLELHLVLGGGGPLAAAAQDLGCGVAILELPEGLAQFGDASLGTLSGRHWERIGAAWGALKAAVHFRSYARRLEKTIDALQPDIVYTNGLKMHALAVWINRARRPILWHVHDFVGLRPVMKHLLKRVAPGCAAAIANSESVARDLKHVCGDKLPVHVIYNAVDLARFSPDGPIADLDALSGMDRAPEGTVRVGLVGTLARWKGQEVFLKALAQLPADLPVRGYIIGGALYRTQGSQYDLDELRLAASRLGIGHRVGFTGYLEDPSTAMRALDIAVHASTKPEPFGLVIVEAMACGRAVIASKSGGAAEIIQQAGERAVKACKPGDVKGLSASIASLARDAGLRQQTGIAGRRACELYFDSSRLARQIGSVCESLISPRTSEMTLLFLNPTGQIGGAEISLLNVLSGLRLRNPNWRIHLITGAGGPLIPRARALGVDARALPFPRSVARAGDASWGRLTGKPPEMLAMLRWPFAACAALVYRRRLRREISALQPDLIHTNGVKMHAFGVLARTAKCPVIWHIRDYIGLRPVMARVLRFLAPRCAGAITNSESVARDFRQVCGGSIRTDVVYNTVDLDRFSPDGTRADLDRLSGLPPAAAGIVRVGLAGTMARWKGHEVFLRALSRLPAGLPVRGYIIGGPVYQTHGSQYTLEELRDVAARLGLGGRIGFTGFVENPADAMRSLDIVVHASTKPEPFGLVIVEAMACRRAVIASNAGGASEILAAVGADAAIACPPNDPEELARRIRLLAENQRLRESLGRTGRQRVEQHFGCERLAGQVAACYREALHGRPQAFSSPPADDVRATALK
jgi:glycosyltransferase involved in cell wall biosynthesis